MKRLFTILMIGICARVFGQIGGISISPNGSAPAPSAALDVNFTNKGFLMPRLTQAQQDAMSAPDTGLLIFNTSNGCIEIYSGSQWQSVFCTCNSAPPQPGGITGADSVCPNTTGNVYSISPVGGATSYNWTVPAGASITANSYTSITVAYGSNPSSGNISAVALNNCGTSAQSILPVTVNPAIPVTPGSISGSAGFVADSPGYVYFISPVSNATTYTWSVPADANIIAGQATTSITVTYGVDTGHVAVTASDICGTSAASSMAVGPCNYTPGSQTFSYTGSLQYFTAPCAATITIAAYGAQGGNHSGGYAGGNGAQITGTFSVPVGTVLTVLVGGQGIDGDCSNSANSGAGGGGGSFVYSTGPDLLIAAGGGGGGALEDDGGNYPIGEPGQSGTSGSESRSCWPGGTGGGNGSGDLAGYGWDIIMSNPNPCACDGGYGGGGGYPETECQYHGGGGGGGYSGGGGDLTSNGCGVYGDGGGGGGSYNGGSNQINNTGVQTGNGQVVITW